MHVRNLILLEKFLLNGLSDTYKYMEKIKNEAKEALKKVYEKYNPLGLKAIYLDGSILTRDFNPETSDVDSIGIVEDSFPVELEDTIKLFLKKEYPQINEFGFRLLYRSELDGGPIKAFLASVIEPQILLSDLPDWELVIGTAFTQKDFKLPIASYKELQEIEIRKFIIKFNWTVVSKVGEGGGKHLNLLKTIVRYIYYKQKERGLINQSFSYLTVMESSLEGDEKEVMTIFMEIRKNKWDYAMFQKNSEVLQKFVDKLLTSLKK